MSREAGRCKLPMRVVVEPSLASLAATGDGVIFVAAERWIRVRDVERTVLHEIAGHALPRARAVSAPLGIFALGTARGTDDQEGRALLIERAAGFLDGSRRRELGLRHLGARATLDGATFVDVVELLLEHRAPLESAMRIASRVQRGGPGAGGLAREIIYIPSLLRVERLLFEPHGTGSSTRIDDAMAGGRIAARCRTLLGSRDRGRENERALRAQARHDLGCVLGGFWSPDRATTRIETSLPLARPRAQCRLLCPLCHRRERPLRDLEGRLWFPRPLPPPDRSSC